MTTLKSQCATCHKAVSIIACRGCTKEYCMRHASGHRQVLGKQMDEIIIQHDELLQMILDRKEELNDYPLIRQVNQWGEESIKKINEIAQNTRQKFFDFINEDITKLTDDVKYLSNELNNAHIDDDYVETDLNLWIEKLKIIKNNLFQQQMINIQSNNKQTPLIFNISINESPKDIFERFLDLELNALQTSTSYGWSTYNNISLNGIVHLKYNGYNTDFEMNDILELIIDCDRKIIRLINQRTKSINELYVDICKCPFSWQINLGLYFKDNRIRILPTSRAFELS